MESGPWQMYGPLILQLSPMNGENLSRKVKGHHRACMQLQVPVLMASFCFVVEGMPIACPYQVHTGLQNIEMGVGSGQLPLVCLHHRDINTQLFLSMHGCMSQEGLLEVVAW